MYRFSKGGLTLFILYESAAGVLLLSWEFFLRGFMLFGLEKRFGKTTVLIQLIPFVGFILGIISLRTRSFIPGLILHIVLLLSLDICIVYT